MRQRQPARFQNEEYLSRKGRVDKSVAVVGDCAGEAIRFQAGDVEPQLKTDQRAYAVRYQLITYVIKKQTVS